MIKLKLKQANDELYVIKGNQDKKVEDIAQMVMTTPSQNGKVTETDTFEKLNTVVEKSVLGNSK
jgi:hypothetical protein